MQTMTMTVSDMSCEGCVNAVRSALTQVDGVQQADVTLEDKTARVTHGDSVAADELLAAVRSAGYTPSLVD